MPRKRKSERIFKKQGLSKFKNTKHTPVNIDEDQPVHVKQKGGKRKSVEKGSSKVAHQGKNRKKGQQLKNTINQQESSSQIVVYPTPLQGLGDQSRMLADEDDFVNPPHMHVTPDVNSASTSRSKGGEKSTIEDVEAPSIKSRTSPRSLSIAIKDLSNKQKNCVRKMGLGSLLDLQLDQIPTSLGYYVVKNLDTETMTLKMRDGVLRFTKEGLKRITDLPSSGIVLEKSVDVRKVTSESKTWIESHGQKLVCPQSIVKRLKTDKTADWLFKTDFSMLFLSTMIECTANGRCIKSYVPFFKDDLDFGTIDWCEVILRIIKDSTERWKRNDELQPFTGPLPIMVLYYVDSVTNKSIPNSLHNIGFKGWNSSKLHERQTLELNGGGFGFCLPVAGGSTEENELNGTEGPSTSRGEPSSLEGMIGKLESLLEVASKSIEEFEEAFREAVGVHSYNTRIMLVFCKFKEKIKLHCDCLFEEDTEDDIAEGNTTETDSDQDPVERNDADRVDTCDITPKNKNEKRKSADGTDAGESQFWRDPDVIREVCDSVDEVCGLTGSSSKKVIIGGTKSTYFAPSFSLGLTQEFGDVLTETPVQGDPAMCLDYDSEDHVPLAELSKKRKGKEVVDERMVRQKRPGMFFRSPYINRPINVYSKKVKVEKDVWKFIHFDSPNQEETVFLAKTETLGTRDTFESLRPKTIIKKDVISCMAAVLNKAEAKRSDSSPNRFYLEAINMDDIKLSLTLDEGVALLRGQLIHMGGVGIEKRILKDYDMIFIPVQYKDQYVLLCFDLKNVSINVIDGVDRNGGPKKSKKVHKQDVGYVNMFKTAITKLGQWMMTYLRTINHPKGTLIDSVLPMWIDTKCATKLVEESGVLTMRHMETFKGGLSCGCGIDSNDSTHKPHIYFRSMRVKYTAKILLDDANQIKNFIRAAIDKDV